MGGTWPDREVTGMLELGRQHRAVRLVIGQLLLSGRQQIVHDGDLRLAVPWVKIIATGTQQGGRGIAAL